MQGPTPRLRPLLACSDIRLLYETLQGPRVCSVREREKLTVALAKAEVAVAAAYSAKAEAQNQVRLWGGRAGAGRGSQQERMPSDEDWRRLRIAWRVGRPSPMPSASLLSRHPPSNPCLQLSRSREQLRAAVAQLESQRRLSGTGSASSDGSSGAAPASRASAISAQPAGNSSAPYGDEEAEREVPAAAPSPPSGDGLLALEQAVVAADAAVGDAKQRRKAAALAMDGAEREQRAALSRLQLCSAERQGGHAASLLPGLAGEAAAGLQRAYAKLWRRQLREGLAEMRLVAGHCVRALRGIAQRSSEAVADLSGLQRLLQAAADPLIVVGRVAGRLFAGSVGSTTAAALMGGLGVLRLGMGVVKFGMQLMLFLALLYYLLAAQSDPLLAAAGVLPLSEHGRRRTAVALSRALGGEAAGPGAAPGLGAQGCRTHCTT